MKAAAFWKAGEDGVVHCRLCRQACAVAPGARGLCGVRENRGGTLYSLVYGKPITATADPIEKKPLFHFLPGTQSYSLATVGCNFRCRHCQNADISQAARRGAAIPGREVSPEDVVGGALAADCKSIAYTYTEPTIFYEYARDIGILARKRGLKNVFVSNGYMGPAVVADAASSFLDAVNVDIKAFSEEFYRGVCGARLQPVLDATVALKKAGVWVEVTTLVIPDLNDSPDELRQLADFIVAELGAETPWHLSRFHPDNELLDSQPTPLETLGMAVEVGREAGLKYIYVGNVGDSAGLATRCPSCGEPVLSRDGFFVDGNRLVDGACPSCKKEIAGVWR